jgi:hypothetical protein
VLLLEVGGVRVAITGPSQVLGALDAKFGAFQATVAAAPDVRIEVRTTLRDFSPELDLAELANLSVAATVEGARVSLAGAAVGGYDCERHQGWLEVAHNLGEIDALVRLALSVTLPLRGAFLLHSSAVVPPGRKGAIVLAGQSGAGKSTSAERLGEALCDELVVWADGEPPRAFGTPYWNGRPASLAIDELVLLERGDALASERLRGGRAVSALAPHVVRYVALPEVDRAVLPLIARACERRPPLRVVCPTGPAFLPALRRALDLT